MSLDGYLVWLGLSILDAAPAVVLDVLVAHPFLTAGVVVGVVVVHMCLYRRPR